MFCTKVSSYVRLARARIKNYEAIYQAECAVSLLLRAGVEINPKIWPPPDDFGAEKQAAKNKLTKKEQGVSAA